MDRLRELVRLHRMGTGAREVARLLAMSPNTEREYRRKLASAGLLEGPVEDLPSCEVLRDAVTEAGTSARPAHERSGIARWRDAIEALLDKGLGPKAIRRRLHEKEPDFEGSYWQVKRLCRAIRQERGVGAEEVAIPVVTVPGKEAQVDFGYVGRLHDPSTGQLRRAWCFVMVLAHSRHMVARVVFDQSARTWQRLHAECLDELGGVPEVIRPDNLKAAVIKAAFSPSQSTTLNRSYREVARHYGFKIDPTPPYQPKKKGKVESAVKYLKGAVFKGRDGEPVDQVRAALARFLREEAGLRTHGTTQEQPAIAFEERERAHLGALPPQPFRLVTWKKAKVHQDAHVAFDKRLFSVPWRLVGSEVWLRATESTLAVFADDARVAMHSRSGQARRVTCDEHLPEGRRAYRYRDRRYWEEQAEAMGPHVEQLIGEIFDADDVLYAVRPVQATMKLFESLPPERVERVCRRASFYGITHFGKIKRIVQRRLDLTPLPTAVLPAHGRLEAPRFARSVRDLITLQDQEPDHEPH